MEERVLRAAEDAGLGPEGLSLVARAHRAAMTPRVAGGSALPSAQHPSYLHPGRTALILLHDLGESRPEVLAAGIFAESRELALRVTETRVREVYEIGRGGEGTEVGHAEDDREAASAASGLAWWRGLPMPDWRGSGGLPDDELLEQLINAPDPVVRIALSEALDHLRHAHRWALQAERARAAELAERVFGPMAPRVHPVLDRRFQWWIRRVGSGLR